LWPDCSAPTFFDEGKSENPEKNRTRPSSEIAIATRHLNQLDGVVGGTEFASGSEPNASVTGQIL
jgi:hypothetical protein